MFCTSISIWELGILNRIQDAFQCDFMDFFMPLITKLGDKGLFWIAVAVVLLCIPKTRKIGIALGIAYLSGFIFGNGLLKNIIARTRPYDMEAARFCAEQLLIPALSDYSFPSGHTLICAEAATVLMFRARKPWGWVAVGIAVLVMFSRLYLYVHFPTDILGGAVLGFLCGYLGHRLCEPVYGKLAKLLEKKNKAQ